MASAAPNPGLIDDICGGEPAAVAAALQAAASRRDELGPVLCARLMQAAVEPDRWMGDQAQPSPVFLPYLAAAWKLTEAHPLIVALLRLPPGQCEAMLDDFITEGAGRTLADTWPGDLRAIEALVLDESADAYARVAGFTAASLLAARGQLPREQLVTLLERAAASPLDPDQNQDAAFATLLVGAIHDFRLWELQETVARLFDQELIDPMYCGDRTEVLALLSDGAASPEKPDPFPPPITDAWEAVRDWHYFSPDYVKEEEPVHRGADPDWVRVDPQPCRAPPKPGRNDPCPCGSGKKYKKCCGA